MHDSKSIVYYQTEPSHIWSVHHNMNCEAVHVTVYVIEPDTKEKVLVYPSRVVIESPNKIRIEFLHELFEGCGLEQSGVIIVSK